MSDDSVVVRVGEARRTGRSIDLRDLAVDPASVAATVRERGADGDGNGARPDGGTNEVDTDGPALSVDCPPPGPAHEFVGLITPDTSVRVRTALAAAARSRGGETPQDEELDAIETELGDLTVPAPPDLTAPRERLAGTDSAVDRIRERVAALRGRVQAGREAGRDVSDLKADLAEATRELSERETERAAAREALERAEQRARESRDARERKRRLEDRRANLEREARAHLVERIRPEYEAALAAVPGSSADDGQAPDDPLDADGVTAALAVARVATLDAPVVLACDRFDGPRAAAGWLDAPVIGVCP